MEAKYSVGFFFFFFLLSFKRPLRTEACRYKRGSKNDQSGHDRDRIVVTRAKMGLKEDNPLAFDDPSNIIEFFKKVPF